MAYSFLNVVSALTAFLLIILASVLLTSNRSTTSARILAVLLLLHALMLAGEMINHSEFVLGRPGLALWTVSIPLLFGPMLWLFTNSILFKNFNYNKKFLWHFIPFLLSLVPLIVFYQLKDYNEKLNILTVVRDLPRQSDTLDISTLVFFTITWLYLIFSFSRIKFYRQALLHQFSTIETLEVNWLIALLAIYGAFSLGIMVNSIIGFSSYSYLYELTLLSLVLGLTLLLSSIFYRVLSFPNFFKGIDLRSEVSYQMMERPEAETIMAHVDKCVIDQQLFTKTYLNIQDVAEASGHSSEVIVMALEGSKEMTFFEYINRIRIEFARKLLSDPGLANVPEMQIMYDSGYNTKRSFHKACKAYAGKIPSDFRVHAPPAS